MDNSLLSHLCSLSGTENGARIASQRSGKGISPCRRKRMRGSACCYPCIPTVTVRCSMRGMAIVARFNPPSVVDVSIIISNRVGKSRDL